MYEDDVARKTVVRSSRILFGCQKLTPTRDVSGELRECTIKVKNFPNTTWLHNNWNSWHNGSTISSCQGDWYCDWSVHNLETQQQETQTTEIRTTWRHLHEHTLYLHYFAWYFFIPAMDSSHWQRQDGQRRYWTFSRSKCPQTCNSKALGMTPTTQQQEVQHTMSKSSITKSSHSSQTFFHSILTAPCCHAFLHLFFLLAALQRNFNSSQ